MATLGMADRHPRTSRRNARDKEPLCAANTARNASRRRAPGLTGPRDGALATANFRPVRAWDYDNATQRELCIVFGSKPHVCCR
jgi:hypothetical protein